MIARWMLASIAFTLLCGVAALGVEHVLHALRKPSRMAWAFAVAMGATWPIFAPLVLTPPARPAPAAAIDATIAAQAFDPALFVAPALGSQWTERAEPFLIAAWTIASLLLAAQLGAALVRLARVRATAARLVVDGEPVLVDAQLGPAVIGLLRPRIVVPEWLLQLDPSLRGLVLRHEREHCRAQDPRLVWLAVVATTAMPWNGALWWLTRRMRLAMELDCDARTLAGADDHARYAKLLLLIAQRTSSGRFVPMLFDSHSQLARRISAMQRTPVRHPALRAVAAGAVALAAMTAACSTRIASNLTSPSAAVATSPVAVGATEAEDTMREFTLDTNAHLKSDSPRPKYPAALRGTGKDGIILAQVVVGRDGRAEPASLRVDTRGIRPDDPFLAEARASLAALQFEPARVDGGAVKQLVMLGFMFSGRNVSADVLVNVIPPGTNAPAADTKPSATATPTDSRMLYFDFQVEKPVVMAPGSSGPRYPDELREQKIEGTVLAQFAVGLDGRAEMETFKVVKTSDPRFGDAVRDAVATMQFLSAEIGGKKVRQLVQQPFQFSLGR